MFADLQVGIRTVDLRTTTHPFSSAPMDTYLDVDGRIILEWISGK